MIFWWLLITGLRDVIGEGGTCLPAMHGRPAGAACKGAVTGSPGMRGRPLGCGSRRIGMNGWAYRLSRARRA